MYKHSIDLLLEACGAGGPVEVVVTGPGKSAVQGKSLFLPLAIIGRESQADMSFADPRVSRRHAYVQMIGGRLFAVDLLSRTGVFLDGTRIGAGWVRSDQIVQVADHSLQFFCEIPGEDDAQSYVNPLTAQTLHNYDEPDMALECTAGADKPFLWRMDSVLALLGRRAAGLGLGVNDPNVAGFHCSILRTPLGVWVFDLLGQDGTLLNGRRIRWAQLDDRDELQIGGHQFRVLITPGRRVASTYQNTNGLESSVNGRNDFTNSAAMNRTSARAGTLVAVPPSQPKPIVTQDFLVALFDQFATVQNQMFDQFQGAMTVMVDMFSDMQREQVGLIRKEVDRLHHITDEVHKLQAELVSRSAPAAAAKTSPRSTAHSQKPESHVREKATTAAEKTSIPEPTPATPVEVPNEPSAPAGFELPVQAETGDGETHVWLYDKISELQHQRHSRFRKIFSFLSGK